MKKINAPYLKEELIKFTQAMNNFYARDNLIKEFCTIENYKEEKKEFIQIGERLNLPKEFFTKEEGVHKDNTSLAGDFIRSLVNGEKDFILKEILSSSKVQKYSISNFNYDEISRLILSLKESTDLFLPIEPYFREIHHIAYESPEKIKFITGIGPVLIVAGKEIKIHWITSHQEIDKIIIINKKGLNIIQKRFDNSDNPKSLKLLDEYLGVNRGNKLMLYFGEKDENNFDFIFRTIISKPELNENSAIVVETKDDIQNK